MSSHDRRGWRQHFQSTRRRRRWWRPHGKPLCERGDSTTAELKTWRARAPVYICRGQQFVVWLSPRKRATSKSSSSASSIADARSMMDAVLYSTAAVAITSISATEAYCVRVLLLLPLPLKVTSEEPLLACKTPKLSALNSVWNYFTMLILRFNGFRTSNSGYLTANTRHVQRE